MGKYRMQGHGMDKTVVGATDRHFYNVYIANKNMSRKGQTAIHICRDLNCEKYIIVFFNLTEWTWTFFFNNPIKKYKIN